MGFEGEAFGVEGDGVVLCAGGDASTFYMSEAKLRGGFEVGMGGGTDVVAYTVCSDEFYEAVKVETSVHLI